MNQSAAVHPLRHPPVRAATLELRGRPYLEAALLLGVKNQVLIRHIFPNVLPIELANAFLTVAMTSTAPRTMLVLTAASASILGDWLFERMSDRGRAR